MTSKRSTVTQSLKSCLSSLRSLVLNDNKIKSILPISEAFPKLENLMLMNNQITNFSELAKLGTCQNLQRLCLINNPVVQKENYRLYVISRIPHLKVLDFQKVRKTEKDASARLFGTFSIEGQRAYLSKLTQKEKIKLLIERTKNMDELERLGTLLRNGDINDDVLDKKLMEFKLI